ncbi:quinone oxidoreductase [Streptomyces sp. BE147]|uniref:quinone oxidoreductase family protein n=1 Tax=Streptomyces sp. BE147 TaxID=3002524 RepID=UPI002E76E05B|nr:quinone oxidoreductase [Streptomyces sp. BE147]MEE1739699.1 quinone oxidoreductase [Streptomyces sp. BE147]
MKAIQVSRAGGPEVLELVDLPRPSPRAGEALVRLAAAGVNYVDVYFRSGLYSKELPFVPGQEGAGTVVEVGPGVREVAVGDVVAWANLPGSYAEYALLSADRLVPVPDGLAPELAAATLLQGMTAHYLCHDTCPVRAGDTVVVHAAAGGVGMLLTQLVRLRGGTVIGTASTGAKAEAARAAGAAEVVDYRPGALLEAVRRHTGGLGAAAVFDGIGGPTFDESLAALRPRGVLAVYGQSGGAVPPFDLQRLNAAGSVYVTRPNLTHHIQDRPELLRRGAAVLQLVRDGRLRVRIGQRFALSAASDAHAALEARTTIAKTVLACSSTPPRQCVPAASGGISRRAGSGR